MRTIATLSFAILTALLISTSFCTQALAVPISNTDDTAAGANNDGTISAGEYVASSSGLGSGFGDVIGDTSTLYVDSDASGQLFWALDAGPGSLNDIIVIYIDSVPQGAASTAVLNDTADPGRSAISGTDGTNSSDLTFAPGFEADYAIVIESGFAGLFALDPMNHTFITALTRTDTGTGADLELSGMSLADLGITNVDSFDYMATYLNGGNAFRSNEFHGVSAATAPAGNVGQTPLSLAAGDFNTFTPVLVQINEVDADQTSTDSEEFVELITRPAQTDLSGLVVVPFNGNDDASYQLQFGAADVADLDGFTSGADGLFLIGPAVISPDLTLDQTTNLIQNGADAVAVFVGDDTDFPNDTAVTDANIVDALVYGTGDADDTGLLTVLTPGEPQVDEDANGASETQSSQRCSDGLRISSNFFVDTATPGAANSCPTPCTMNSDCGTCETCNTTAGVCEPETAGVSCDTDSNACTIDTCDGAGACTNDSNVDCSGLDDTCVAGVCNTSNGMCETQPANEGGMCDDGDMCTNMDVCTSGVCGGMAVDCSGLDDDCNAGVCNGSTGMCEAQPANEGGMCDDGDMCTTMDVCTSGTCGGMAVDCSGLDDDCNVGACNGSTGMCEAQPANEGAMCDDADSCTTGTTCTSGTCSGGMNTCQCMTTADCGSFEDGNLCNGTLICDSNNQCVVDSTTIVTCDSSTDSTCMANTCDPGTGMCSMQPRNVGMNCDDGNQCTSGETCDMNGMCVGANVADNTACDLDADACTLDVCLSGTCTADGNVDCSAQDDQCNLGVCDPADGTCSAMPLMDGTVCDDGDQCTEMDECTSGACGGSTVADGTICDDGNPCTEMDECTSGACDGTPTQTGTACGDDCNAGMCDPGTGTCITTPVMAGTACDDGNPCTENSTCDGSGTCDPGTAVADGTTCDDDDFCTQNDECTAGTCDGTPRSCMNAADQCNMGICNSTTESCDSMPLADGTTCDDGDMCTGGDECQSGMCVAGTEDLCMEMEGMDTAEAMDEADMTEMDGAETEDIGMDLEAEGDLLPLDTAEELPGELSGSGCACRIASRTSSSSSLPLYLVGLFLIGFVWTRRRK